MIDLGIIDFNSAKNFSELEAILKGESPPIEQEERKNSQKIQVNMARTKDGEAIQQIHNELEYKIPVCIT